MACAHLVFQRNWETQGTDQRAASASRLLVTEITIMYCKHAKKEKRKKLLKFIFHQKVKRFDVKLFLTKCDKNISESESQIPWE